MSRPEVSMLILTGADVRRALPMGVAVEAMKGAFAALSAGRAVVPPRTHLAVDRHAGISLVMPSLVDDPNPSTEALAVKVVSVFSRNAERGLARIQAAVLVLDPQTGTPQALLEGAMLTALRTAAASGAATDLLARPDSRVVALFGAGVQARAHLEAMRAVRPVRQVRVYSRSPAALQAFVSEQSREAGADVEIVAAASPQDALAGADIVCTCTTSAVPVFDDADLAPGAHVNAVGSYQRHVRETPAETVARAWIVVDSREAAWDEAGDILQPLAAGQIGRDHVRAELGELVLGRAAGRGDASQITLFKSVGVAVQDAAAARVALEAARELGLGTTVPW